MFKVLEDGTAPTRGSKFSACVDLYASEDVVIGAGETVVIGLGVCIDDKTMVESIYDMVGNEFDNINVFMNSHYIQLMLRSSLGKKGLILPNGVGVIDLDYRDEIKLIIHNPIKIVDAEYCFHDEVLEIEVLGSPNPYSVGKNVIASSSFVIKKGDKIAQITLLEHKAYLFGIESDAVRDGGLGSTGN